VDEVGYFDEVFELFDVFGCVDGCYECVDGGYGSCFFFLFDCDVVVDVVVVYVFIL